MRRSYDVIVVGAGPAGATLAYELARRGIAVLVLEKDKLPRYKPCAGGVTGKAAKLLDFDISGVVEDAIQQVMFTYDLGSPCVRQSSQPLMYTVMRDTFDRFLADKAQAMGAALKDGEKVTRIRVNGEWLEISAGQDAFRARIIAGADGAYSVVASRLGIERRIEYVVGIESEVVVPGEELGKWESRVQMDLGCIPGGYGWVFPKRDHLSVGVGCVAAKSEHLKRYHEMFLNSLGVSGYTVVRSSSHLIPTCVKGRHTWRDKALLLGDAAGFADPLTGEGIYNAILSGKLAAPVIVNYLAGKEGGLQAYEQAVEEKIMPELRIARTLARLFVRFPHLAFRMLNQREGVWRAGCQLMLGETNYAAIKETKGGFKGILSRLVGA